MTMHHLSVINNFTTPNLNIYVEPNKFSSFNFFISQPLKALFTKLLQ